jgi:TRAP-type C4-dicarboxylate transport system permease small subunit
MADEPSASARSSNPVVAGILRWLDRVVVASNSIGSLWALLLVLLVTSDAMGRTFFAAPIKGVVELVEVSIIVIVFGQLADTVRTSRLTRSDGFLNLLGRRLPGLWKWFAVSMELIGAAVMALILYGMVPILLKKISNQDFIGDEGIFTIVEWPIKAVIVFGAALTMLRFLARALEIAIGLIPPDTSVDEAG